MLRAWPSPSPTPSPTRLRALRTRPLLLALEARRAAARCPRSPIRAGRRIGVVTGGEFDGERLAGTGVGMDGGSDWQTLRA